MLVIYKTRWYTSVPTHLKNRTMSHLLVTINWRVSNKRTSVRVSPVIYPVVQVFFKSKKKGGHDGEELYHCLIPAGYFFEPATDLRSAKRSRELYAAPFLTRWNNTRAVRRFFSRNDEKKASGQDENERWRAWLSSSAGKSFKPIYARLEFELFSR